MTKRYCGYCGVEVQRNRRPNGKVKFRCEKCKKEKIRLYGIKLRANAGTKKTKL